MSIVLLTYFRVRGWHGCMDSQPSTFWIACKSTWEAFGTTREKVSIGILTILIGIVLGFIFLGSQEAMKELHILILYVLGPLGGIVFLIFLWTLWLAPFKSLEGSMREISKANVESLKTVIQSLEHEAKTETNKNQKKEAEELPGARTWKFKTFEIACLLADAEPQWPLPTQKAKDDYQQLSNDIGEDKLGGNRAYYWGTHLGKFSEEIDTTHEFEIDRRTIRMYLHLHERSIPEFLEERFDYAVMPEEEYDEESPHPE